MGNTVTWMQNYALHIYIHRYFEVGKGIFGMVRVRISLLKEKCKKANSGYLDCNLFFTLKPNICSFIFNLSQKSFKSVIGHISILVSTNVTKRTWSQKVYWEILSTLKTFMFFVLFLRMRAHVFRCDSISRIWVWE